MNTTKPEGFAANHASQLVTEGFLRGGVLRSWPITVMDYEIDPGGCQRESWLRTMVAWQRSP